MDRYWIYIDKQIQGPFEVQELLAVKGFCDTSQVCMAGEDAWQPARQFPAIRFQLAPAALKIAEALAPPHPTLHQAPNVTKVSSSGDYISPDFQFEVPRQRPMLRFRRSTRQPSPRTFRVVPLPQPPSSHVSRGLPLLIALISLSSGLWAYGALAGLPAPVVKWWQSHIETPSPVAPPSHQWRPAIKQTQPPSPIPASVSHPKHSKAVSHRHHQKRHTSAHATHPVFSHTSRKPWFDLHDKQTARPKGA